MRQEIGHSLSLHVLKDVNLSSKALLCLLVAIMLKLAPLVSTTLLVEEATTEIVEETSPIVLEESVVVLATVTYNALQILESFFFGLQFVLLAPVLAVRVVVRLWRCWVDLTDEVVFKSKSLIAIQKPANPTPEHSRDTANQTKHQIERLDVPYNLSVLL